MRYYFSGENEVVFDIEKTKNGYKILKDKLEKIYSIKEIGDSLFFSSDDKEWKKLIKLKSLKDISIASDKFNVYKGFKPSGVGEQDFGSLVTQMPGKIVKLFCSVGDEVKKGDTLLILEAMKMENEIKAGADAVVKLVNVEENQSIESGHLMLELDIKA